MLVPMNMLREHTTTSPQQTQNQHSANTDPDAQYVQRLLPWQPLRLMIGAGVGAGVGVGLGDPVAMATTGTVARVFSLRWPGVSDNAFVETVALPPLHTPSPPPLPSPILCSEPSAP